MIKKVYFITSFLCISVTGIMAASSLDTFYALAISEKDPNKQISFFREVLQQEPNNIGAVNNLGLAYKKLGKLDSAYFYLKKAERLCAIPEILNNIGNLRLQQGDTAEALTYYTDALKKDPLDSYILFNMANLLWQEGEKEMALEGYKLALCGEQAVEIQRHLPYQIRAELFIEQLKTKSVLPTLIISYGSVASYTISIPPQTVSPLAETRTISEVPYTVPSNDTGNVYYFFRQFDKALYYYHQALKENPSCLNARINLALCYFHTEEYERCISELEEVFFWNKIRSSKRGKSFAYNILKETLCGSAYPQCDLHHLDIFKEAAKKTGNRAFIYYSMGVSLEKTGKEIQATAYYKKALQEDPCFTLALEAVSLNEYRSGDILAGVELLSKSLKSHGKQSEPDLGFGGYYNPEIAQRIYRLQPNYNQLVQVP